MLVNCAGSAFRSAAEDFPEDRYDALIALNLKGSFLPCQAFGRQMLAQQSGSIINIASIGAFIAYPHAIAYLQSKGGVMQLTRGLALEWRDRSVRVNAIAPTLMDTALIERMDKTTSITSDFIVDRMLRDAPRPAGGAHRRRDLPRQRRLVARHRRDPARGRRLPGRMTELRLEALVPEMEFGTVVRWLKQEGDPWRPAR